ncbi:retrotransposon protein [Cucumis melo var. makuwa]|uniref:Retrotransposon protein n=1 Tax=Cucumis melo var. makuwa TaxID=1194695 RepID=A0A5D3DSU2_CUCMM|nr:retrotransposon protein [Cucumis melo var. makuwa]TYK26831.1 retrotransposon protein [Cucumis melo var. makuwa]
MRRDFSLLTESRDITCKSGSLGIPSWEVILPHPSPILTCCLLHNLINKEMTNVDDVDGIDEGDLAYATTTVGDDIHYIETLSEWTQWCDEIVATMFNEWQLRNK